MGGCKATLRCPLFWAVREAPPTHPWPLAMQVSKSACVLTTQAVTRLLRSKEAAAAVDIRTWPTILDTGACPHTAQDQSLFLSVL